MMETTPTWNHKIAKLWSKSQSAAQWRLPITLFVCGLLAYGVAYAWHTLANYDLVNLIRDANYDDSFYYFQIAYNLSQGKFSTFDGGITQTNGYHPVWMLLITPFYWAFDKETALFGIKAFEIMLVAGGVALITLAAWQSRLAWPLLFAALPMLYHNPFELLLGLEAAAAMFTLSILILAVCIYMRDPQRWKWHIAAIAFALPWVRIEYIAISLAATAALCVIEWSRQERRALRLSELANIRHAYIPLIGAAAGILVYFAYNRLVFGAALPVNVLTKRAWSQIKWAEEGGYSLAQNFWDTLTLQVGVFDYELLIAFEICAYLLLAWRLALRSKERRDWLLLAFIVGMFGLAAGHIAKFAQTVLTMHPIFSGESWYFAPAYLMSALIIPIRLYVAIHLIRRFIAPRWSVAANALRVGVFVIGAAFLLGIADFAEPFRWVDRHSGDSRREFEIVSYMGAQIVNQTLPEGSVVGSWDAGVIGYFSRFPVVNLDGLVNSYAHFHARHIARTASNGNGKNVNLYRLYGITHFANNMRPGFYYMDNVIFEGASIDKIYDTRQFRIWTYDPPLPQQPLDEIDHSHWVWERMKPQFDYLSDGVGVMFAGRTAQAFIKDCAQDEILVWTWQERKRDRSVRLEISPYRSRTGMCADMRVLPLGARQSAQVKLTTPSNAYSANLPDSLEPIIRSDFDVYISDRSLIYTKSQCSREDTEARFFASVFPVDTNNLPARLRDGGYYIIDFAFDEYGAIDEDGMCWAEVALPGYPIAGIHTGQYAVGEDDYHYLWQGNDHAIGSGMDADFENLADREPTIRSDFDVYIDGYSLIYAKWECSEDDIEATFFVSVIPRYSTDMSARVGEDGYEALDFEFRRYGAIADGGCYAKIALPDYPIAEIHTGQYVAVEDGYEYLWEGVYHFNE